MTALATALREPASILEGRLHAGDLEDDADVVIVGSGASGAVTAQILAEAGLSVIVVEEGGHVPPERYSRFRPTESMRHMFRDGGTTAAIGLGDTPLISILAGRTVGGSSTLTGGVIFRIPEEVLHEWATDQGLTGFAPEQLEAAYRSVEETLHVETVPEAMRSPSTRIFAEGARKRGFELEPMRRNTRGCQGASRCNFGCPHGAKLSVDVTYLVAARRAGARVISDCEVTGLTIVGGKAVGITGRLLSADGRRRGAVTIRAGRVILASSALYTPLLLAGAGVGRFTGLVGRNLTLHPGCRVAAFFDRDVSAWKGSLQSAYASAFEAEGLHLNSIFAPPNILSAMFPGVGPAFTDRVRQIGHLATFGTMVHDAGGGRVHRLPGGRPLFTYRMARRDKLRLLRGIKLLGETFFAAGAREVLLPIFGIEPVRSVEQLAFLDEASIPARRFECVTFHPLGTARMGVDAERSVVRPSGESWDVKGLHVVDGSIFPSSIGVNSQLPIMAVATKLAWELRESYKRASRGTQER